MTAFEKVREVLINEMNVDGDRIAPESSLAELAMDSLETAFLITALEAAFEMEVLEDDFGKLRTVQDVADYAESKLGNLRPAPISIEVADRESDLQLASAVDVNGRTFHK